MITDTRVDDADIIARHPERGAVPTRQAELSRRWYLANAERKKATQKAQYRRLCAEAAKAGMKVYLYIKSRRA